MICVGAKSNYLKTIKSMEQIETVQVPVHSIILPCRLLEDLNNYVQIVLRLPAL